MSGIRYDSRSTPRADLGAAVMELDPSADGFVASQALPIFDVKKDAGTLPVITRESFTKRAVAIHKNGSYNKVNLEAEDLSYACLEYGLEGVVFDKERSKYASDFDADLQVTNLVRHRLLMEEEIRVKDVVFNTTTFNGTPLYTDNKATPWSTATTDIFAQVAAAKVLVITNSGAVPDTLIIGYESLSNLLKNDDVVARFPGAVMITEEMIRANLASLFGMTNLIVGKKVYDTAVEGQAFSGALIWPKTYAMVCKKATANNLNLPGLGGTMQWSEDAASEVVVESYRSNEVRGDVIRVRQDLDELLFDKYFGHLMRIET